jgi:hypothetical protein
VEVDHDLQASTLSPVQSLAKLVVGALDEWLAVAREYTPVPDGDPHVVEASLGHLLEVVFGEPRVPMLLQSRLGGILAQDGAECPLVDGIIALEKTGGDPGLEDEPSAGVDATNLLVVVVEGGCASYRVAVLPSAIAPQRASWVSLQGRRARAQGEHGYSHGCTPVSNHDDVCAKDLGITITSNRVDKRVGRV